MPACIGRERRRWHGRLKGRAGSRPRQHLPVACKVSVDAGLDRSGDYAGGQGDGEQVGVEEHVVGQHFVGARRRHGIAASHPVQAALHETRSRRRRLTPPREKPMS